MAVAASVSLVLAGLWHGAAWNFVAWGGWFAVVWLVWRVVASAFSADLRKRGRPLGVGLTFAVVAVGMLLFREPDLARSAEVLGQVPWSGAPADRVIAAGVVGVASVGAAMMVLGGAVMRWEGTLPSWVRGLTWAAFVILLGVFWSDDARDFVYFQF